MSYYPAGYGQWPDPASYLPFSQTPQQKSQPQTQHPAPAYSYPPSAPTAQGPYTASQAAFNHNATQIPGLGAPGAGTPSHYQSPWQPPPNYAGYAQQTPTSHNPPSQTLPAAAANDTTQSPPKPPNDAVEEGELEEEDFDDLYEPQPADNVPKVPGTSKTIIFAQSEKDVDDAQDEAFYGAERGKVMSNRGGTPDRERSGSYSPYLSPREIDLGAGTSHDTSDAETGRAQQTSRLQAGTQAVKQVTNGVAPKDSSSANPTAAVPSDASSTPTLVFRSADEAKKEAQKSILRLLPLGVKLQNYIDEGLDENIVKSLFGDLNLLPPPAPAKPTAQSPQTKEPAATEASTTNSAKPKDQAEERKDRIARLLAAKAAKTAATAPPAPASSVAPPPRPAGPASARGVPSAPLAPAAMSRLPPPSAPTGPAALQNLPPPSAPTGPAAMKTLPPPSAPTGPAALRKDAGPSAASKAKSKTDKELLLKKKMEALLKAREAQAQQSAAAASAAFKSSASAAPGLPNKDANTDASVSLPEKPPAPIATSASEAPAVPSAQPAQKVASPTPTSSRAESTIPGLYLSTSVGSSQSSRKRPVAADFVDYKMSVGTPKRPFGQNRQDSFVIDISEDEESDQDVEMEVDSPAAGSPSSSSQQVDTSGRRGPSIKDFPPLSDGPYKRPLSRTSSNGPRPAKLHQLSGEISSLQRKIAELEARKAKKSSSGAQTPSVAVGTPIEFPESAKGLASDPKINGAQAQTTPHEAESSGEADGADLASAQLISEAASASLPQRIGHSKNAGKPKPTYGELGGTNAPRPIYPSSQSALPVARAGSEDDRRVRITSIQLPKVEATLLEKKTKLKLLEQKTAQLRLEIEKEAAEKEKLAEELRLLDEGELVQAVSASRDSELAVPSVAEPASTVPPSQTDPRAERDSLASNSISEPTKDSEPVAYGADGSMPSPEDDTATAQPMDLDDEDISTPDSPSNPPAKTDQVPPVPGQTNTESSPASDTAAADAVSSTPATEPNASPKPSSQPIVSGENRGSEASTPESGQVEESEPERPSSAASQSPRRPDEVGDELSQERDGAAQAIEMEDGSPVPATISGVSGPSSNETEQAQEMGSREGPSRRKAVQLASFTPYESPLKNFRSYRFHPEYANNVPGGLKSLTYTNKINPNQELCLDELIKGKCEDPKCGFQHFASMKPKDDYILLELGRADEFAEGEEKKRFIGGLRDLLAAFRTEKVRNYDKIGYGIIEYRRKFIGDDSRVLSGLHNTKI